MCLADQAFAYGGNSLSYPSVATQFNIHFISAAEPNDELTAECRVLRSGRRVATSEMTVTNQAGKLIAKADRGNGAGRRIENAASGRCHLLEHFISTCASGQGSNHILVQAYALQFCRLRTSVSCRDGGILR